MIVVLITQSDWSVVDVDLNALRTAIVSGTESLDVTPLHAEEIELIAWSGSRTHLENVLGQLPRVATGAVEYLTVRAGGLPVAKGGIDFAKEPRAGTIWQVATHPLLRGLGLATRLIGELESCAIKRGVRRLRIGVGIDNHRARRLYEHLGYEPIGESEASWMADAEDGSQFLHTAKLIEMLKEM